MRSYPHIKLQELFNSHSLAESEEFAPGDAVTWKKGLKNKKYPKEGQSGIVIEVLDTPNIQDDKDSGSPYYREPLDLVLALLDNNSDLVLFHYDKRRFKLSQKAAVELSKQ